LCQPVGRIVARNIDREAEEVPVFAGACCPPEFLKGRVSPSPAVSGVSSVTLRPIAKVPEPTSQLRVEQVPKALRKDQLLVSLVRHRELHAASPGTLVDVEAESEWFVQSESPDGDWVILSAKGASATLRVSLTEPEFGIKWRIPGTH
jgi:hypothetical protein